MAAIAAGALTLVNGVGKVIGHFKENKRKKKEAEEAETAARLEVQEQKIEKRRRDHITYSTGSYNYGRSLPSSKPKTGKEPPPQKLLKKRTPKPTTRYKGSGL